MTNLLPALSASQCPRRYGFRAICRSKSATLQFWKGEMIPNGAAKETLSMKTLVLVLGFAGFVAFTNPALAQEQDPLFYSPSQALRQLYHKLSHGPRKTGVDVRTYEACPECGETHDPEVECIQRVPVPDCVTGTKRGFFGSVQYEYVVVAEVRYRWKSKYITKEIPADGEEPVCKTEEGACPNIIQDWTSSDECECKVHCESTATEAEAVDEKRIECVPGQTTIKVRYKTLVKEPYTVYRQIKRPIGVKQPCNESVDVPVTRYVGQRLKKERD